MTNDDATETTLGTFTLTVVADATSGWTCVQVPDSATLFGTGKTVKVRARVNGHPYEATMLPIGGGTHMLPLRAPFRRQHQLELGDQIELTLLQ
ncbi:DUF1905 domain-containing protein [Pseudonocardia sp. NPDC049635]|uniref:DUF1905 domain-containing protein n=1 Tax=Pseudonocardia sp. NPDC049635 TaxID=3155506 RepID=UPI0033E7C65A